MYVWSLGWEAHDCCLGCVEEENDLEWCSCIFMIILVILFPWKLACWSHDAMGWYVRIPSKPKHTAQVSVYDVRVCLILLFLWHLFHFLPFLSGLFVCLIKTGSSFVALAIWISLCRLCLSQTHRDPCLCLQILDQRCVPPRLVPFSLILGGGSLVMRFYVFWGRGIDSPV